MPISADMPYRKHYAQVLGRRMAYVDSGSGNPVVFLHGNPTSSYLWRNVMPHLAGMGRLIAPDLIGMGDSDKLPDPGPERYRFVEHKAYLDALLAHLDLGDRITFVVHDWGSALGFHWARRNPARVRGIAYMEAVVQPLGWDSFPPDARPVFEGFRSDAGEDMVLNHNVFVERVLPGSMMRRLDDDEMAEYRRPFAEPGESRRPTLTWPREIPIDGKPTDVAAIVEDYSTWLQSAEVPKLLVAADPGAILTGPHLAFARNLPNQCEVTVPGVHFVQEDSPDAIGTAVHDWLGTLS